MAAPLKFVSPTPPPFGRMLRAARHAGGFNLCELADHLGVPVPVLSDIELGHLPPLSVDQTHAAAAFLGVNAAPLLAAGSQTPKRRRFAGLALLMAAMHADPLHPSRRVRPDSPPLTRKQRLQRRLKRGKRGKR